MIKAGKMREVITIQAPTSRGPLGQPVYADFLTGVRASLEAGTGVRGGHELSNSEKGGSEVFFTFTIRYVPGIKPDMRIVLAPDSRLFKITHLVTNMEGNVRTMDIYAREVFSHV